jgi:hypothetical protein
VHDVAAAAQRLLPILGGDPLDQLRIASATRAFSPPWWTKRNTQKPVVWWMEACARSATAVRPFASHVAKPEIAVIFTIARFWPKPKFIATVRESV